MADRENLKGGLGIKPLQLTAVSVGGCYPWYMMNRDPCGYRAPSQDNNFPITSMQLDKGYEIQRNAGDPQEIYDRVEETMRITNALHLLNVFLNFQDLFQSNERVSDGKSEAADKNYVYLHPLLATQWGRQQRNSLYTGL